MLRVSEEVHTALVEGRPVVALESSVIAHGLPYPDNVATALDIEQAVRDGGAVPATIGIIDGRFVVGMNLAEIEWFAQTPSIPKVGTRDVAIILAGRGLGATTVASTLIAADLARIPFFSTAEIGGVHRGAGVTFDVSADLVQLTRSRVAVVCAGAESILDLGLTLEYLETLGIPIIAYRCNDLPAFHGVSSGHRLPHRLDDDAAVARAVRTHWALGGGGSVLIASPIEQEDAILGEEIERILADALAHAEVDGVRGHAITPYLMKGVGRATAGRSTRANRAVSISTARKAGRLAKAYAERAGAPEVQA